MPNAGFFKGEKKKAKKSQIEKKAQKSASFYSTPQVEIIGRNKKKWY